MNEALVQDVREFLIKDFTPRFGEMSFEFSENPLWDNLRKIGTELWLDTGNIRNAAELWTKDFTAVSTNTTLLNHEVQQGTWDALFKGAFRLLSRHNLPDTEMIREMGFILRAMYALGLVEKFDAFVCIDAHADSALDPDRSEEFALRLYDICPERFIAGLPFTSAGVIASRRLSARNIPVSLTLGFSARQNYVATRLGRPRYVGVFVGRLGSVVKENDLGSGEYVGEKTALASQRMVRELRASGIVGTRQIASSIRNAKEVVNIAGVDIATLPPAVADAYRKLAPDQAIVKDRTGEDYTPGIDAAMVESLRFDTLWNIPDSLIETVIAIEEKHDVQRLDVPVFEAAFSEHGNPDLFPCWTPEQARTSSEEGKIPDLSSWKRNLSEKLVGLDSLMNFAGLNSFRRDQKTMDARITGLIKELQQS